MSSSLNCKNWGRELTAKTLSQILRYKSWNIMKYFHVVSKCCMQNKNCILYLAQKPITLEISNPITTGGMLREKWSGLDLFVGNKSNQKNQQVEWNHRFELRTYHLFFLKSFKKIVQFNEKLFLWLSLFWIRKHKNDVIREISYKN